MSMHSAVLTGTGLYQPPFTITNAELVQAFNRYVDLHNALHADAIARGEQGGRGWHVCDRNWLPIVNLPSPGCLRSSP